MASDRTILHLVNFFIPDPLSLSRIMTCTLLSLSYAPGDVSIKPRQVILYLLKYITNDIECPTTM